MRPSTKIIGLAFFTLVLIGVYTLVWYTLADQLRQRVDSLLAGLAEDGIAAECRDLDIRGYPFRLGVFCDAIAAAPADEPDRELSTANFRSAAQIYRPNHIVSELDGPVTFAGPAERLEANWQLMHASTVFGRGGLERASLEGEEVVAAFSGDAATGTFEAGRLAFHARQAGPDLDLAMSADDAALGIEGLPAAATPTGDVAFQARLAGAAGYLEGEAFSAEALRGTSGTLESLSTTLETGASLQLSGPFEIDEAGLISGTFDIVVADLARWQQTLSAAFPQAEGAIATARGLASSLGGGSDSLSMQVGVRNGRVFLGIIPIGEIPAI